MDLRQNWTSSDFDSLFAGWGICSVWALAVGIVVVWRIQRTVSFPPNDNARPVGQTRWRHFVGVFISSVGIPLLLCLPFILILHYDASQRASANAILMNQIKTIDAQLTDVKDLNKIKSSLLARKQIVDSLDVYAMRAADALIVFGGLPSGVQLESLEMKNSHLTLAIRSASHAAELSMLDVLSQRGYRDQKITSRQFESKVGAGQVTIEAISARGESK